MGAHSTIEWTDASWNPVTGCDEISPGCDHCYAKVFAERWRGVPGHAYTQGFDLKLWPERLTLPATWKKPRRIFVNSMSDLFHKDVPDAFIEDVFQVMLGTPRHIYQVLTKRAKRMARFFAARPWLDLPKHIWIGVTIESDAYTWRADYLRQVSAAVRWVSAEPLLSDLPSLNLDSIHWLVAGGESGYGARPMNPDWARNLRERCANSDTAFFFKQWGAWHPDCLCATKRSCTEIERPSPGGRGVMFRCGKSAGRLLDGREWNEVPQ